MRPAAPTEVGHDGKPIAPEAPFLFPILADAGHTAARLRTVGAGSESVKKSIQKQGKTGLSRLGYASPSLPQTFAQEFDESLGLCRQQAGFCNGINRLRGAVPLGHDPAQLPADEFVGHDFLR